MITKKEKINFPSMEVLKEVYKSSRKHFKMLEIQHMKCIIEELYKRGYVIQKRKKTDGKDI